MSSKFSPLVLICQHLLALKGCTTVGRFMNEWPCKNTKPISTSQCRNRSGVRPNMSKHAQRFRSDT